MTVGDEPGEERRENDADFLVVLQELEDKVPTLRIDIGEEVVVAVSRSGMDGATRAGTDVTPDGVLIQIAFVWEEFLFTVGASGS